MVRGKKADKVAQELEEKKKKRAEEIVEEVVEDVNDEPATDVDDEEESESFKKVLSDFREDGGWVHIKKKVDGKVVKIGKYRPNDFDKDEIAKEFGGGTYFYTLRDNNGQIRARSEETYIDKKQDEKSSDFLQMAEIIKQQTKEIETLKAMISKPKEDTSQNMVIEVMKQNQTQQLEILKAIAGKTNNQPTSMTEMLTAITTIMTLIDKNKPQVQEQPKNNIGDLVELAGLFADMKASGDVPKQETIVDVIKTFLTDGSLANVMAILKQPKAPIVKPPQQQLQQPQQPQAPQQPTNDDKSIVQDFFKQYEKQLFQLKVEGGNADFIANTIIPFFDLNKDFKTIGYSYFKDVDTAYNGLLEVSTEFKNEQKLLKEIVEIIHNYFDYNNEGETANGDEN